LKTEVTIKSIERINTIDFTKGILVILMVVYHSLNRYNIFPYQYLPFVAPGFIMISGFLITQIYFTKYGVNFNAARIRLTVRSIKLLLIFTILNIAGRIFWPLHKYGPIFEIEDFFGNWADIYFVGNPYQTAFDVLLPISYTLFLSILIPRIKSLTPYFIIICAIITFSITMAMDYYGKSIYNINMTTAGIVGILIGLISLTSINRFAKSWQNVIGLLILYGVWFYFFDMHHYTQISLTIIALLIIYSIGVNINLKKMLSKQIVLLGKYSLICYIIQIAYLKIMMSLLSKWNIDTPSITITVCTTTIIMYFTVVILDLARSKYKNIDIFYKTIFA